MREHRRPPRWKRWVRALGERASVHAFALLIALAWVATPEALWQEARLGLAAALERPRVALLDDLGRRLDPRCDASGASCRRTESESAESAESAAALQRCAACTAWERALAESELLRHEALATLAGAADLHAATGGLRPEDVLAARVLGGTGAARAALLAGPARRFRVRLDRGRAAGIEPGQPVTSGAALIGRIVEATAGASELLLVTSPRFHARAVALRLPGSAHAPRAPIEGVAEGDGATGLTFRPAEPFADVAPGDRLFVAWGSGFAPQGALLGAVTAARTEAGSGRVEARVEPAASLAALDRVLVIAMGPFDAQREGARALPPPAPAAASGRAP